MAGAKNVGVLLMFLSSLSNPISESDQEIIFKDINDAAPSLRDSEVERILMLLAERGIVVRGDGERLTPLLDAIERTMPKNIRSYDHDTALRTFHSWSRLSKILDDSATKKAVKESHAIALVNAAIQIARGSARTLLDMAPLYDSTLFNHAIKLVPQMDHRRYAQEVNRILEEAFVEGDEDTFLRVDRFLGVGFKFFLHREFLNHFSHTARWLADHDRPDESVIIPPSVRKSMYQQLQSPTVKRISNRKDTTKTAIFANFTYLLKTLVSQMPPDLGRYTHLRLIGALLPTEDEVENYATVRLHCIAPIDRAEFARYTRLKSLIGSVSPRQSISRRLFDDLVQASLAADAIPLAQCVTPPVMGPTPKQGSTGSIFDYGLFSVHVNKDANKSAIEIDGRVYEHVIPLKPDPYGEAYYSLPGQSLGTCYVFAALNAVLNETVFVEGMLRFLEEELGRSAYSRKAGETNVQVNARRFGQQLAADITLSRDPGNMNSNVMSEVFEVISSNKEIFMWSRNVILYHTLKRSLKKPTRLWRWRGDQSSSSFDSRTSLFMKDWSIDRDIQNKFNKALEEIDGGQWQHALEDIFTLSGIHTLVRGRTLLATVPRTGETLCIGEHGSTPDQNGSFTGILRMNFHNSSSGHANAWFQRRDYDGSITPGQRWIIESNTGEKAYEEVNKAWWLDRGKTVSSQYWASAFTCVRGDTRARYRGGEPSGDTARATRAIYQAAVIAPTDVSTLATCDNEKCELDDDLKAALLTVGAFVTHYEPPRTPDTTDRAVGGRPGPAAIPAVSLFQKRAVPRSLERQEPFRRVGRDETNAASWPITMTALSAVVAVLAAYADNVN